MAPSRSHVVCEWLVRPRQMARRTSTPDAVDFWDLTNRQDWAVCELQQEGHALARLPPAATRYGGMVHAFDLMVADRYANDGSRTVRGWRTETRRTGAS